MTKFIEINNVNCESIIINFDFVVSICSNMSKTNKMIIFLSATNVGPISITLEEYERIKKILKEGPCQLNS